MRNTPLRRMWINQPSSLQVEHPLHGTRVLAEDSDFGTGFVRVWFLDGDIISKEMSVLTLSRGWPAHLR